MVFDIVTRFNFYEGRDSPLRGRAYVFKSGFEEAYHDLGSAIGYMKDVIHSPELRTIREGDSFFTNAVLWGLNGDQMIDIFGWKFGSGDWKSNPGICSKVVRNGIIVPAEEVDEITCENGLKIMSNEGAYRPLTSSLREYLRNPPRIEWLNYTEGDFTNKRNVVEKWMEILRQCNNF